MADQVAKLIKQLQNGHYYARSTAARELGAFHDARARDALIDALTDKDSWVVEHAAEALGRQGDPAAVPALTPLLDSDNYQVRTAAAAALGALGNDDALPALKAHADDQDTWVRDAIRLAIDQLESSQPAAAKATTPEPDRGPGPKAPATVPEADALVEQAAVRANALHKLLQDGSHLLKVTLPGGRTQKVRVITTEESSGGIPRIRLITVLGPAEPEYLRWALRQNLRLTRGALGLLVLRRQDYFALTETMLFPDATRERVIAALERLAHRGDMLEAKLCEPGSDTW